MGYGCARSWRGVTQTPYQVRVLPTNTRDYSSSTKSPQALESRISRTLLYCSSPKQSFDCDVLHTIDRFSRWLVLVQYFILGREGKGREGHLARRGEGEE